MKRVLISLSMLSILWVGCGDTTAPQTYTGQLVDSPIENADYTCGDGVTGVTDSAGGFSCARTPISFGLKGLHLGTIASLPVDGQIFPQELLGLERNNTTHESVVAMARFLQSCDDDNLSSNGLRISDAIKTAFQTAIEFNATNIQSYITQINTHLETNITLISSQDALDHLESSTSFVEAVNAVDALPATLKAALLAPPSRLNQETINSLAYMGNEERLAYDLYNTLYAYHMQNGTTLKQLTNIATKSEGTHIQTVQLLVKKYISNESAFTNVDLTPLGYKNSAIADMNASVYDISAIQTLYDALVAKGVQSAQDALEVGCMVEVTDINDLVTDIQTAQDSNASDVVAAFTFLRDASYTHYWAFDSGLKTMGVAQGCCQLGESYCHAEYPNIQQGQGKH